MFILTEQQIVQKLPKAVQELQKVLSASGSYHGWLRGSLEAVLAEAQGAEIVGQDGQPFNHYQNLADTLNALRNNSGAIRDFLGQIRALGDFKTVQELSQDLRPLLDLARDREAVMADTKALAETLEQMCPDRLAGVAFGQGGLGTQVGRTVSSLISTQLQVLATTLRARGIDPFLIPQYLRASAGVLLEKIEEIPITIEDAAETAAKTAISVRLAISQVLPRLGTGAPSLLQRLAPLLEALWTLGGRLISIPLILVDQDGNPIGMRGAPGPGQEL
jgi:hypothetical protein